ncbi:MAG TPA: hypothetical protein VFQ52_00560 [Rhizomicrobium sp.]|nr:hypothetical protein [Rhizomicrobium sp.]
MRRRGVIAGLAGLGAMAAASLYRFTDIFVKHYPPTPYDDVLARLEDREQAAQLGAAALKQQPDFDIAASAQRLRVALEHGSFREVVLADAETGRVQLVDGWVLPQSVVVLSAIAAKV